MTAGEGAKSILAEKGGVRYEPKIRLKAETRGHAGRAARLVGNLKG